uniref:IS66 family transposase n=1 Tax=Henriciella aquimarina TaxID=545261 RepID=UPI0038993CB2
MAHFYTAKIRRPRGTLSHRYSQRGMTPQTRIAARQRHSSPIIAALKPWFEKQLSRVSSGSKLAEDIL